ncbi:DNA polymerase III, subunits gamma and tau [[Leptolyngbya] sp. PCC 7376]|uniref:DNA polymerase III subunit gamma/tau n=1 Tax=[Leptolyngbya] sp. PCC 7376 TaxID=111781 RepID=UPI00029ED900|nr:DNA polymerase III subunit gamma/tau [[Leptolyngbya] sp. PCC 7376]AFY39718.1 DNA polymerase III, subunits gamma and tau [[Leptolyngbya] sp. PCC 7376]
MPYEPLHHKYRPQMFSELVGQEAIATTLSNALEKKRIAPAYLFSGPRGTGKTSSARILAKSLNCLNAANPTPSPCGECEVCRAIANGSALDVIEIDAASNTGVDNIRELIERSQFAPVQCRYKVYVIDECHMLSVAAFNALLKTLEEPPAHVVFVLATTDPQRVLPTIISRCQRFDYRRIPLDAMVGHLRKIARNENIEIPLESVILVAQIANGGLRDAESLLDQLSLLSGEITPDKVWDLVGAVPERDLLGLIQVVRSNNPEAVIQQCRSLLNRGREPLVVLQNLASFYLNLLIAKTAPQRGDLIAVTQPTWQALCQEAQGWDVALILKGQQHLKESEYQLKNTTQPRLWLEITLLGLLPSALANIQVSTETVTVQPSIVPAQVAVPPVVQPQPASPKLEAPVHPFGEEAPAIAPPTPVSAAPTIQPEPVIQSPAPAPISISTPPIPEESGRSPAPTTIPEVVPPPSVPTPEPIPEPIIAELPVELTSEPTSQPIPEPKTQPAATTTSTSPTISALEREQLWETMLAQLHPPATQQLLRQTGRLVSFNGNMALIGAKTQPLLSLTKGKQKNIEAAFKKACQKDIKVSFQVGYEPSGDIEMSATVFDTPVPTFAPAQASPSAPTPPVTPPNPTPQKVSSAPSTAPNPFSETAPAAPTQPAAPKVPAPQPTASSQPTAITPTSQSPQPLSNGNSNGNGNGHTHHIAEPPQVLESQDPAQLTENSPLETLEAEGDRLKGAALEFAEFFEGEVIELTHLAPPDPETEATAAIKPATPASQPEPALSSVKGRPSVPTEISPEDDIPF